MVYPLLMGIIWAKIYSLINSEFQEHNTILCKFSHVFAFPDQQLDPSSRFPPSILPFMTFGDTYFSSDSSHLNSFLLF